VNRHEIEPAHLAVASSLAACSSHPLSRAIAATGTSDRAFDSVTEHPGFGIEATGDGATWRLGRPGWAAANGGQSGVESGVVLARDGHVLAEFRFEDRLRDGAAAAIAGLKQSGLDIEIVSGDREAAVAGMAGKLGVKTWAARVRPGGKTDRLGLLAAAGRKVLMVGDGLNDAPALVAAHASMAPASAADVGRTAADFVFLRPSLTAVTTALDVSRRSAALIRQNFAIAIVYNAVAVPVAVLGHVTPLVAALAMSLSSILVVGNAMRLRPRHTGHDPAPSGSPAATLAAPLEAAGG